MLPIRRTILSMMCLALQEVTRAFSLSLPSPRTPRSGIVVISPPSSSRSSNSRDSSLHHDYQRGKPDMFGWQKDEKVTSISGSSTQLWMSHDNEPYQDDSNNSDGVKEKLSTTIGRVGGRRLPSKKEDEKHKKGAFAVPGWLIGAAIPLCLLWFVSHNLLGGSDSPSSFVYYQSSVYESSIMGEDGKLERSRKESVRTNVPSLIHPAQGQDQEWRRRLPLQSIDAAFDQAPD